MRVAARLELLRIVPWGRVTPAAVALDVPPRLRWFWRLYWRQGRRERWRKMLSGAAIGAVSAMRTACVLSSGSAIVAYTV